MGKMKKILTHIFSICACVVMVTSLAACGKSSGKEYKTVKEYLDSKEVQDVLKEEIESYKAKGITVELTADDSSLTYICTYDFDLEPSDALTAAFEEQIASSEEAMQEMLKKLSELVEAENLSIVFRYYSADGTELYSHEFK